MQFKASQFRVNISDDNPWSEFDPMFIRIESSFIPPKQEKLQSFNNSTIIDPIKSIANKVLHRYEERSIIRNNLQLNQYDSYLNLNEVSQNTVSRIIADFYSQLNHSKYIWDRIDFDTEDDLRIIFMGKNCEVSISIEDVYNDLYFDSLDSYLSIFSNGRRISYSYPLKSLIGIINQLDIQ